MISNYFKIFSILLIFIFSIQVKSKANISNEFKANELSKYFSAIIALDNDNNDDSLRYFKLSRNLKNKHSQYFKKYISSLVLNQKVKSAIQEIKIQKDIKKKDYFEANLLMAIDNLQKKKYDQSNFYLEKISRSDNNEILENIIIESLKSFFYTFENKKITKIKSNYRNLDNLNLTLMKCYLNDELVI